VKLHSASRFLTPDELQDELAHFTYRPGWKLEVFVDPWEGPCLYVSATVVDGYDHAKTVDLGIRSLIPPMRTRPAFADWLLWRMLQIESHECREYLHRNGKPWVDPHDPIEPY
jgi:hypothetical protein